ncbi:DNA-binding transcriptional LysR family regulator [Cupriavidus gilardii J11]|uniref:DNA-binding transcriptional LysR family regulator n=1 Tax=Cupriavidus gilardii J11 TaxID=936133 RepID=A0A562BUA1_9BURK|nr:LysR family transcriptional regulator [Cupriavidus gilardii]TWG88837.1 DNA-binding transcriptional LysR family regulator [Cupriavidus gilardii J11]
MELRHLRYFRAVAEELNVTRAAARLHIAQPPLSRQIRQLEDEIGVALFERVSRGLRLTEAGRFLLEQSMQLTQRLEETVEGTRRIGRNEKRWFGIGFVPSVLYGFLPGLIRELRAADQNVEVGLSELITIQQVEALKAGRIDIAFGRIAFDDPAIARTVVMAEALVAAVPRAHPLLKQRAVDAEALAAHPLILYPARPRPSYADHVLSLFRARGLQPHVALEANELQTALGMVAAGLGITLVPASVQRLHRDDVRYHPIDAAGFTSPVIMSHRADDRSPFLMRAVEWVRREAGRLG